MKWTHRFARLLAIALVAIVPGWAIAHDNDDRDHEGRGRGLSGKAFRELHAAGLDKYLGQFRPAQSQILDGGWTKHTFDPQAGKGPICIVGSPYTAYTRPRNPTKVMVYLNGGGACWQNFYNCTPTADAAPPVASGIFADSFNTGTETIDNPLADWSIVYGSYCDGSVFSGDNAVPDAVFPGGVRHHRGLRNASAVIDLAKANFPHVTHLLVAGSSAGGLGAATWTPFLARFAYGNIPKLMVFNDAGPTIANLNETTAIQARAKDWAWGQFLPASCKGCSDQTHFTPLLDWRLSHDDRIREAFYITDADAVLRFFLNIPTQSQFRELVLQQTGLIAEEHGERFRRFIRSGTNVHTSLRLPLFYVATANGVPLHQWTRDFLRGNRRGWKDIVEPLVPAP